MYSLEMVKLISGKRKNSSLAKKKSLVRLAPGVDPTKLFFFGNEEFFHFLLLSLAVAYNTHIFLFATNSQAYKQKSGNRKNESLVGLTPGVKMLKKGCVPPSG